MGCSVYTLVWWWVGAWVLAVVCKGSPETETTEAGEGRCIRGHFVCSSGECTPLRPDEECIAPDGRDCPFCGKIPDETPPTNLTYGGTDSNLACTPPYIPVAGMCLLRIIEPTSWDQARKTCRHFYGFLANLNSLKDLIAVVKHLERKEVSWPYWVGMYLYNDTPRHYSDTYPRARWVAGNSGTLFASLVVYDIVTGKRECGFIPFSYGKKLSAQIVVTSNCDSLYVPLCRSYPIDQRHHRGS